MAGEIKDPTMTGPVGLKGLKGPGQQSSLAASQKLQELQNMNYRQKVAVGNAPNYQDLTEQASQVGYGESVYDEDAGGINFLDNLQETRAQSQPWITKVGGGIVKGTSLAATTFLDTFAGTAAGIINAAATGTFSGLWDNPVTQGFNALNENLEKLLPNYYTAEETKNRENGEWYKNIFTANFLGDTLLKNTGFMVGAALSGKVVAGAAAKLMQLNEARKAYEGYAIIAQDGRKAANLTEKLKMVATGDATIDGAAITQEAMQAAKKLRSANQKLQLIGATSGALGEARLEAVSNSKEYANRLTEQLNQSIPQLEEDEFTTMANENPEAFDDFGELTPQGQQALNERIEKKYTDGLAKIEEQRAKFGNRDFITNFALLAGSDYVQFGRMYAGGFKNAVRGKNIIDKVVDGVKIFSAENPSILKKAWAIAKMPITEGPIEEMGQATIAKTLNQYYGAEFNSFMGHQIDPNANKESIGWLNAIGEGAKETYGTMAGWEEGFVGGLMGAIGIPMRVSNIGKDGKPSHAIRFNGAIGELRDLKEGYQAEQQMAEEQNKRWQDPKFQEYYKANNRRLSFGADKEAALEAKDEFEFKNAEHSELISDAILFDKTGRIQDLYDHIESMNNLSDEDIEKIKTDLTKKDAESLPYANLKDNEDFRQYFKERAAKTIATLDNYRKIADDLAVKSGDTFKGDDLSELVWMLSKVDNWEKRFHQVHKDLTDNLRPIVKQLNKGVYKDADEVEHPIDEVLNESPGDLLAALSHETFNWGERINKVIEKNEAKAKKSAGEVITQELQLDAKTDNRGLQSALGKLARLKNELKANEATLKNSEQMMQQIDDLGRLSTARMSFLRRYNTYIANPERLKQDQKKVVAEAKKEEVKIETADIKEKKDIVDKFTTYEEYREYLNKNFKSEKEANDFNDQMADDGHKFAKQHKEVSLNVLTAKDYANKSKATPEVKEAAKLVFDRLLGKITTNEQLFDQENAGSRDLYDDLVLGKEEGNYKIISTDDLAKVEVLVKQALANAQEDYRKLKGKQEIPNTDIWTPEDGITKPETNPEIEEINRERRKELEFTFGKNVELAGSGSTYTIDRQNIYSAKYPDGMGLQNGEKVSAEYKEINAKYDAQIAALKAAETPGKDLAPKAPQTNEGGIVTTTPTPAPTPQPEEEVNDLESKRADIENRRQKELDKIDKQLEKIKANGQKLRTKIETYRTLDIQGNPVEVKITTFDDGSRELKAHQLEKDGSVDPMAYTVEKINNKAQLALTNEVAIEKLIGNEDNTLNKTATDTNPDQTYIDKVNTKYNAELAALEKTASNSGQNQVWWNPIPEYDVNEKKKGIFIPHYINFPQDKEIWDYFKQKHTWDYLNKPNENGEFNIKEGDEVRFMIVPSFRKRKSSLADVIFVVHGPKNQIIGSLHSIKDAHRFAGLLEQRDRIEKEFMDSGVTDKPFISSETTVIGKVNGGYVKQERGKDTNLNDKEKGVDKTNLVFSIASKGLDFYFAHPTIPVTQITPPNRPGMVYMHEKMADGNYASVPLSIKTFNKQEFDRADVTTQANPLFHIIDKAVDKLANARQPEDADKGYLDLSEALFLGESKMAKDKVTAISSNKQAVHISLSTDKTQLIISKKILDDDGIYREHEKADIIFLTEADKNPNDIFPPKNLARNNVESIKDQIYESLYKNDILFNVDATKINTPGYNEMLYDSNILKTAMVKSGVETVWFYLQAKTPSGTPIAFVAPSLESQSIEGKTGKGIKMVVHELPKSNPVVESESVIKGTKVNYKGDDFFVDNGVVTNSNGGVVKGITVEPIRNLAYIRDGMNGKFGTDFEKNHRVSKDEWKVQDGSVFNVATMAYAGIGDARKEVTPVEKTNEIKPESTPSSSPLGIKLKRDPNLMGSYGEKSTDFKNSQTNAPKNQEMSKKIPNFAKLDGSVRVALTKAKWTAEKFDALNDKEKEHAIKCVM